MTITEQLVEEIRVYLNDNADDGFHEASRLLKALDAEIAGEHQKARANA